MLELWMNCPHCGCDELEVACDAGIGCYVLCLCCDARGSLALDTASAGALWDGRKPDFLTACRDALEELKRIGATANPDVIRTLEKVVGTHRRRPSVHY